MKKVRNIIRWILENNPSIYDGSLKEYEHISHSLKDLIQDYSSKHGYGMDTHEMYDEITDMYPEVERYYKPQEIMQWIDSAKIRENVDINLKMEENE
jgi:hypothetical protein